MLTDSLLIMSVKQLEATAAFTSHRIYSDDLPPMSAWHRINDLCSSMHTVTVLRQATYN